jgi:hypothetical protein
MVESTAPDAGGRADVVYVLLLLQAGLGILAMFGTLLLMGGNPAYLVVPLLHAVLLSWLATRVARRRRWAYKLVVALQMLSLIGYQVNLLVGLIPQVEVTINLVGLLTTVALPVAVLWQCVRLLGQPAPAKANGQVAA